MSRSTHDAPGDGAIDVAADPYAAIHPEAAPFIDVRLLTSSRAMLMGSGDVRPPVRRPGSMDAARLPSLMGGRLVYPEPRQ